VTRALEPCDGSDLDGKTCQTVGFFSGKLQCTASCQLNTKRCYKLASSIKLHHRTLGPAPDWAQLAFSTNVLAVAATRGSALTVTPYNWDLRGPWGKSAQFPLQPLALTALPHGWLLFAPTAAGHLEARALSFNGDVWATVQLPPGIFVLATRAFSGGALVALRSGTDVTLVRMDKAGALEKQRTTITGDVLAATWHRHGFLIAQRDASDGRLRLVRYSDDLKRKEAVLLTSGPVRQLQLAMGNRDRVIALYTTPHKTLATRFAAHLGLRRDKQFEIFPRPVKVIALGYAGSTEGNYMLFQKKIGTIRAATLKNDELTIKTVLRHRGARALAATSGYQQIFIAWIAGGKLHLTRFFASLQ
jgi:hypothetical protein